MNTEEKLNLPKLAGNGNTFPEDIIYSISEKERELLEKISDKISSLKLSEIDSRNFFDIAAIYADEMSENLRKFLRNFRNNSNLYGAVLLTGLPQELNLQSTPLDDGIFGEKQISVSEKAFALIMSRIGEPRAYGEEKNGMPIQNVYAVNGYEYKQENTGSLSELLGHTEDGFMEDRCDFLGLSCLRSDHEKVAQTGVSSAWRVIDSHLISSKAIEVLRKPLYRIRVPSSFMGNSNEVIWSKEIPVLSGDLIFPEMCVDFDAMKGVNSLADRVLAEFGEALRQVSVSTVLQEGDLLIIDNKISSHFRTGFRPKYDGKDRWLQRIKVVNNPRASQDNRKIGSCVVGPIAFEIGDLGLAE